MGILKKHPAVFLGLAITLLFLALALARVDFIEALELKLYDMRVGMRSADAPTDAVALVDIDNDSIEKLGRWPWPRSRIADGIEKLHAAGARIIGLNIIYSEPDQSSALKELQYLSEILAQSLKDRDEAALEALREAQRRLDYDTRLATALKTAGNVVLPIFFKRSLLAENARENALTLMDEAIRNVTETEGVQTPEGGKISMPIAPFREAAMGLGHVNLFYDTDGKVRREKLLYKYGGLYFPAFTLEIASLYKDIAPKNIRATLGEAIHLGPQAVPLTGAAEFLVSFKQGESPFKRYSFYDLITGKIPDSVFKDRIVIITPTAEGVMNPISTPVSTMSLGEFTANAIWSILNNRYIEKPGWNRTVNLALILIFGAVIALLMPRLKALIAGIAFMGMMAVLVGGAFYLFIAQGIWVEITYPLLQLILGYIGVMTINFFVTETRKERVEEQSAETNRMLGISFQSQGMLDLAFDKFRRAPVDDEMKDILYGLGKEYERKRQFTKAASVYEYIETHDPKYKDVARRKTKLVEASETMIFGDGFLSTSGGGDDMLTVSGDTRPTLGRYEIIRQIGKGAMGVVYLGQDPRINRTTAIKTFRFTEDHDPEEAEKLKTKFFREAESAGTLSHPNIVTIYDAGDEQDLAYIAMEYLEGEDLQKYTKPPNLLTVRRVIDVIADIAEGLDYAHQKGIVHRDIKPANVMLLKNGVVKITDFGIARITADSQTQTGIVKGTPHYMSPEQISGEKVDGRSDIFSLGSMMFQMLTGRVPFKGDSPAALMHQIMNTPHPNPRDYNPRVIKPLASILDKAMEKEREKRYQRAVHMAAHLRTLGKKIDAHAAQKKKGQGTVEG